MKIAIENLIRIYDTAEHHDIHEHVSAITGMIGESISMGILKHYFLNANEQVSVEILKNKPREQMAVGVHKNKGKRLDGWMSVKTDETIFYQIEIKNWSAHSIAGYRSKKLSLNCDKEALKEFADYKFKDQWNVNKGTFSDGLHYVSKVLKKMETPNSASYSNANTIIEPLICYWYPISPKERFASFFRLDCQNEEFKHVNFFSLSLYLRELLEKPTKLTTSVRFKLTTSDRLKLTTSFRSKLTTCRG